MAWYGIYRSYDDDALVALANAGLLRRAAKDVEAGKVEWLEQSADAGVIGADGQRVSLDAKGLPQARCDCPAPGMCKHILGAVLWLRGQGEAAGPESDSAAPAVAAPAPEEEILAFDLNALFKAVGRAGVRQAFTPALLAPTIASQPNGLAFEWPELRLSCRYLCGLGLAGMVSELPARDRDGVHLAALLAVWRAAGRAVPMPEWLAAERIEVPDDRLGADELELLEQVEGALAELLGQGLGHVGDVAAVRLGALAISVRGEGLPRLAAMLRNLAGLLSLLVRRDDRSDSRGALSAMARLAALIAALRGATGDVGRLKTLRGRVRRDYLDGDTLELLPVGAEWWQTRGGARGLTLWCWDDEAAGLKAVTLARPDASDGAFDRHSAWGLGSLWPGAGSVETASKGALRLNTPRLADDFRLAAAGATQAEALPPWAVDDPRIDKLGEADWQNVIAVLRDGAGLAAQPVEALLLRPKSWLSPRFDEVGQRLDWAVFDVEERALILTVRCEPLWRERVASLMRRLADPALPLRAVLVRVNRFEAVPRLEPVALLLEAKGVLQPVSLDYDPAPYRYKPSVIEGRILKILEARRQTVPTAPHGIAARCLDPLLAQLEAWAELGRPQPGQSQRERLAQCAAAASDAGLELPARLATALLARPDPLGLLRLYYVAQLAMALEGLQVAEVQKDAEPEVEE